jgi:hypothetical protein
LNSVSTFVRESIKVKGIYLVVNCILRTTPGFDRATHTADMSPQTNGNVGRLCEMRD